MGPSQLGRESDPSRGGNFGRARGAQSSLAELLQRKQRDSASVTGPVRPAPCPTPSEAVGHKLTSGIESRDFFQPTPPPRAAAAAGAPRGPAKFSSGGGRTHGAQAPAACCYWGSARPSRGSGTSFLEATENETISADARGPGATRAPTDLVFSLSRLKGRGPAGSDAARPPSWPGPP